jgi:hypothetical protein
MKASLRMDGAAVSERLTLVSELADLRPSERLNAKIGMSGAEVLARIRLVSELRGLCLALGDAGRAFQTTTPQT